MVRNLYQKNKKKILKEALIQRTLVVHPYRNPLESIEPLIDPFKEP